MAYEMVNESAMTAPTIPHVKLPTSLDGLPQRGYDTWLVAGTPAGEPYPCTCWYMPCRGRDGKCQDAQRTEGDALPAGCCGRRNARVAEEGFVSARPASREPAQSAVAPSAHPEIPASTPEAASGELSRPRAASSCGCETPWDPPAPVLLIAAGKDGPVRRAHPLPKVADVRAAADEALSVLGCGRVKPWKDGRHVLLPPQPGARGKTRPCWHAMLDDGTLAVLDTPDETSSGVHCPDCCRNFQNAGAWGMHRTRGRYGLGECKDPATVKCIRSTEVTPGRVDLIGRPVAASRLERVTYGAPMLKRTAGGVWSVDPLAPWGVEGPSMTREEASSIWSRAQEQLGGARCAACFRARRGQAGTVGHSDQGPWEFGCGHNRDDRHNA